MALVIFLRGVNVGGHRTFRPSMLAKELRAYDVVNVGAAGTLVVRKPGSQARFCAELRRRLPFEADVMFCDGRALIELVNDDPFRDMPSDVTRFVSVLAKASEKTPPLPVTLPKEGDWLVRVFARRNQFLLGVYRRDMKTIGCLGQMDKVFGGKTTTRNWNTIVKVASILG